MIERTRDEKKIREILTHEAILPNISDDNNSDFPIPLSDEFHYLINGGALFILHPDGKDWQIHANVLPESRDIAFETGQEAIEYAFNEIGAKKLVAYIHPKYINVYKFALKSGLIDSGMVGDRHYLTLERKI